MAKIENSEITVTVNPDFTGFASKLRGAGNRMELKGLAVFLLCHKPTFTVHEPFASLRDLSDKTSCSCGGEFSDSLWWAAHVRDEYARYLDE